LSKASLVAAGLAQVETAAVAWSTLQEGRWTASGRGKGGWEAPEPDAVRTAAALGDAAAGGAFPQTPCVRAGTVLFKS